MSFVQFGGGAPPFGMGFRLGIENVLGFLYYMFMDHYYGQSIGKKVMNIRVTKVGGGPLSLVDAAIEAFGKVFLLPLDFLAGYFLYKDRSQRLFNYLSDTVVIREM
ncbi:RDD family protein [Candidatus Bathyarchaeota archaeon]|nr:RDD family protein [Candidatus Bathyarchaeota archaeon]